MRKSIFRAPTLVTLALLVPACASNKPAPEPDEELVNEEEPEGEPAAGATEPVDDTSPLGVPTCDKYIDKATECSMSIPESGRGPVLESIAYARRSWRPLAGSNPDVLESACVEAYETLKQTMAAICPSVAWE